MLVIALLDREHLDNGPFLKSLSVALSQLGDVRVLFIHADSEYTDRVMQLGVMREEALIRSTRELNRRLSSLFSDEGSACVGLNGYQRDTLMLNEGALIVDSDYLREILAHSHIVLSNMVADRDNGSTAYITPARLAATLANALKPDLLIVFSTRESGGPNVDQGNGNNNETITPSDERITGLIPAEMRDSEVGYLLAGLRQFAALPDVSGMLKIKIEGLKSH
ncbi:MAG: hypothetical protein ABR545_07680 [Cyclonatronaceae bacterium]